MTIDVAALPSRCLIDTGVFVRWLGDHHGEEKAKHSIDFVQAMLKAGKRLLVSSPTVAEAIRHKPGRTIPNTRNVEVVSFDDVAAGILGNNFHREVLVSARDALGVPIDYIKYDAMIVACASRHKAGTIVTLDGGVLELAKKLSPPLIAKFPNEFYLRQATFAVIEGGVK